MKKTIFGALSLCALLYAPEARAGGLDACGDIFVEGGANCEVVAEGGCTAQCEPAAFNASCASDGALGCQGSCTIEADVACQTDCQADCTGGCDIEGGFDCKADCEGRCSGDCSAQCSASDNQAECEASCQSTCTVECGGSCEVTPPEAQCDVQCEASCSGSCTAEANMDCQIECQIPTYVECKAELQGGCEAQCEAPSGALFCDGQFIDVSNVDDCAAALQDLLNAHVEFHAEASASASLTCSVAPDGHGPEAPLAFGLMCLAAIGLRRRAA